MKKDLEFLLKELTRCIIEAKEEPKPIYQKEEIPKIDPKKDKVQEIYKKFKKIETDNYWNLDQDIFYKQAKFLENFEDNFEIKGVDNSYPDYSIGKDYSAFTLRDFRIYFSWRTKIRKGIFEDISWCYQKIYITELLNQIGCKNEQQAIDKLIDFWRGCRQFTVKFDTFLPDVIKEFYISNTIQEPYEEIVKRYPISVRSFSQDFKDIQKGIYKDKVEFFNKISNYKIAKSKLRETKYGYLLEECTEKVFSKIHEFLEQEKIAFPDMLIVKEETKHWWGPLSQYYIYKKEESQREIVIEGIEQYQYKKGIWKRTLYLPQYRYRSIIGCILKIMECYIRDYLGYRKMKLPDFKRQITKELDEYYCSKKEKEIFRQFKKIDMEKVIYEQVMKLLYQEKIPKLALKTKEDQQKDIEVVEKVEVTFNQSEFEKIRKKSEKIQKALIIEENEEMPKILQKDKDESMKQVKEVAKDITKVTQEIFELPNTKQKQEAMMEIREGNVYKVFVNHLTNNEKEVIHVLLNKTNIEEKMLQIAQKENQMVEVMISNINDKALENIGDTIIGVDRQGIYEDYEEEIRKVL